MRTRATIIHEQSGYSVMLLVIILTAVALTIMLSMNTLSMNRVKDAVTERHRYLAHAAADACAELGIEQVILASSYTGSGSATFTNSSCTYTVTTVSGSNAQIDGVGTAGPATRKTRVTVVRNPFSFLTWLAIP